MKKGVKYSIFGVFFILTTISPYLFTLPRIIAFNTTNIAYQNRTLVVGTIGSITHLDPHKTYWSTDTNTYIQSCEGLFQTNLSNGPLYPITPYLAEGWGIWDTVGLTWTIPLKQGITFHDGTKFNASIVEWNYARINNFIDEGICEWSTLAQIKNRTWVDIGMGASADYNATEHLFILKNVTIIDEYTIALGFHYRDATVMSKIAYEGWVFISINSIDPTESEVITTLPLIGTGPYILNSIEMDGSRTFIAYENYWRGKAQIQEFRIQWVSDSVILGEGMLGGPMNRLYDIGRGSPEQWPQFRDDSSLIFIENLPTTVYYYCGINTDKIALPIRKALAACLNISYIIDIWFEGNMNYMTTPVTPGIPFSKIDCEIPQYDVVQARQYLVDAGLSQGLGITDPDEDWIDLATSGTPIGDYNITYREGSATWGTLAELFIDNAELIGIQILEPGLDGIELRLDIPSNHHMIDLFFFGFGPDYLDPHNMIWDAFASPEANNPMRIAQSADPDIIAWRNSVEAAVLILNQTVRENAYHTIQCELMADIQPWIPLFNLANTALHSTEVAGDVGYNPFGNIYFYAVEFNVGSLPHSIVEGLYTYSIILGIFISSILGVAIFLGGKFLKNNLEIKRTKTEFSEIKTNMYNAQYSDSLFKLKYMNIEKDPANFGTDSDTIDTLIKECEINLEFMERQDQYMKVYGKGDVNKAYQGLLGLLQESKNIFYTKWLNPIVKSELSENLKQISTKMR